MFEKALVATDLSEASDHVINCLPQLTPLGVKDIVLCQALGLRHLTDLQYVLSPWVEPRLAEQQGRLHQQGYRVSTVIAPGHPRWEIERVAREQGASLVVVGSHGHGLASGALLGNTAFQVLHHTSLPVLLIRLAVAEDRSCRVVCESLTRHVLHPTDFSENAMRAFEVVEQLAGAGLERVTLLHVQEEARVHPQVRDQLDEFNRKDRLRLDGLAERLKAEGAAAVTIEIPFGSPVREILQRARAEDCKLVVMGSQGRGFIEEVFMGSVSHNIARHASVPLLLVPPQRA